MQNTRYFCSILTLNPLTWKIWWAPNNASRWQMGFNSACKGLMNTWIFPDSFSGKSSNTKFHENSSSGSRVVPCGRTYRFDETNSRFPQFCKRAWKKLFFQFFTQHAINFLCILATDLQMAVTDISYAAIYRISCSFSWTTRYKMGMVDFYD